MLIGHYEAPLVILSILVAIFASYTALSLAARVGPSRGSAPLWIAGGAFAMGTGIWGMHFVGMLAFRLPIALGYDLGITLVSWLLPVGVSGLALWQLAQDRLSRERLALSGLLLGVGINAMHYVGMSAMRMDPPIDYAPSRVAASVAIAIAAATAALWIAFRLRASTSRRLPLYRAAAAVVMGFAIAGMHYTGMAAATFRGGSVCRAATGEFTLTQLAALVVLATVSVLAVTLMSSIYDARLEARASILAISERTAAERQRLLEQERALRTEAERLGALKDEFLATLSHELRTPLNAIVGWAHVLRTSRDEGVFARAVETIERNARLQSRLIDDLLDMSRIVSGGVRIEPELVEIRTLVDAAVDAIRPLALPKQIEVLSEHGADCGRVWADPARLQQVFWNLLTNAVKFTPPHGRVTIATRRDGGHVVVRVEDTGIGISADFLPHVFERFRQADASTTRRHGGLGLGLAIAHQLVELHGGSIEATSEGLGRGTALTVRLPLASGSDVRPGRPRGSAPVPAARPAAQAADALAGLRVLVVDDEADARDLVRQLLREHGAVVEAVASAAHALAVLEREVPDVLVSDIGMSDIDGFELIRRVRSHRRPEIATLRAVALTAFARAEDEARSGREGFDAFLRKPVDPAKLVSQVAGTAASSEAGVP